MLLPWVMVTVTVQVSSAVKSQQDFLALLRSSSPVSNTSCSTFSTSAADLAWPAFSCTSTAAAPPAASCPGPQLPQPVGGRTGTQQQQLSSLTAGLCPSVGAAAGLVHLGGSLSAGTSPAHAPHAASLHAGDSSAALLLLQQLAQLQQLMQQPPLQPQVASVLPQQLQKPAAVAGTGGKHSKSSAGGAAAPAAATLLTNLDKGRLQQLARHLQGCKLQQRGSSGISRVSSDLTQMLALSVSLSSEDSDTAEDGTSLVGH